MLDINYFDRIEIGVRRKTHTVLKLTQIDVQEAKTTGPVSTPAQVTVLLSNRGRHNCTDDECPE
jgi:hypothetical protein